MLPILKHTWAILNGQEKKAFTKLLFLDILISLLDILSLAALLWLIQFYIQPAATIPGLLPAWLANRDSVFPVALFFVLFSLKNMAAYFIARAHYRYIGKVAVRVSEHNLSSYQLGDYDEFIQTDSSVHIRKVAFQPFEFCQYMLAGIQQIITQSCLIAMAVVAILLFNAKLFLLLLLILMPPVIFIFYWIKQRLSIVKKDIRSNNERSFQYLLDALKGYAEGNIYNRNPFFLERFIRVRKKFSHALFESISLQHLPGRVIEIVAVLGLFILIAIAKWTNGDDGNNLLTIGAFMAAAYRVIPGVVKIINLTGQIKAYEVSMNDLVAAAPSNSPYHVNGNKPRISSIEARDVSFHYKNDKRVINNISFSLQTGDMAGISGASGKGKTTLLNILCGFIHPANGEIILNGSQSMNGIRDYWPSMAYVRQQSFLINDTLLRNITLEEDPTQRDKLYAALDMAGLNDMISADPDGLDRIVTENGKNISGGQQQRISIARAIYKDADLVLLDEPFNELDENSETRILQHLKQMAASGKIILLITHNKKALTWCNKLISLDEK